ncbi:MAG: hypothetical protein SNJ52_03640 [Verrucomicrobiia bacterium]
MLLPKGRFKVLQRYVGGMLEWRTYRRIYDELKSRPDLDAVEVGAARGAGSIAAAMAYRDLRRRGRLIVVEKLERGSRSADGTYMQNLNAIESLFAAFKVTRHIQLYPKHITMKNGEEVVRLIRTGQLSALIHDADGRLDRDFFHFGPFLIDDAFVLIDDYEDRLDAKTLPDGTQVVYGKKRLTFQLLTLFAEWGLFVFDEVKDGTAFGRKPKGADWSRLDLNQCAEVVRAIRASCTTPSHPSA